MLLTKNQIFISAIFYSLVFSVIIVLLHNLILNTVSVLKINIKLAPKVIRGDLKFKDLLNHKTEKNKFTIITEEIFNFFYILVAGVAFIIYNYIFLDGVIKVFLPLIILIMIFFLRSFLTKITILCSVPIKIVTTVIFYVFSRILSPFLLLVKFPLVKLKKLRKKGKNVNKSKAQNIDFLYLK